MQRETFERALHMWPDWHESIERSRRELGHDPSWPVEQAIHWIEENYVDRVRPTAVAELDRLGLPPNLLDYWEDCFYCSYRHPDGSVTYDNIRRRIAYKEVDKRGNETGRWIPAQRSLPKLPYEIAVVYYPGEDIQSAWVRLELMIHGSFAGRDMLDETSSTALRLLRHLHATGRFRGGVHPVSRLIGRAKANLSERKRSAVERHHRGDIDFEGLLEEEWLRPDTQWTVTQNIQESRRRGWSPGKALKYEQDRVYNVVRRWFANPKPMVKEGASWRRRLPLPENREHA